MQSRVGFNKSRFGIGEEVNVRFSSCICLISGLLLTGHVLDATALPRRTHSETGVLQRIDNQQKKLMVVNAKRQTTHVFTWTETTRFKKNSTTISSKSLLPGRLVRVSYRKEPGRYLLKELKIKDRETSP